MVQTSSSSKTASSDCAETQQFKTSVTHAHVKLIRYHRNGRLSDASAGSIMGPYGCGSLMVVIGGGQPRAGGGRSSADWAASAEPCTLPRRLSPE